MEFADREKPAIPIKFADAGFSSLCRKPARVSIRDDRRDRTGAVLRNARDMRAEQALGGKQRHLRVVGDRALAIERGGEFRNAGATESVANLRQ